MSEVETLPLGLRVRLLGRNGPDQDLAVLVVSFCVLIDNKKRRHFDSGVMLGCLFSKKSVVLLGPQKFMLLGIKVGDFKSFRNLHLH